MCIPACEEFWSSLPPEYVKLYAKSWTKIWAKYMKYVKYAKYVKSTTNRPNVCDFVT